ncbi:MAG: SDR family oxidoreductase [Candidatus Marinimicrobia bacterium]|nr:SDR family oxidoreductase [Candidatus Neomarinimicrobiota bacterium]
MKNNTEKRVIVTGAGRGIGKNIALKFAESGYKVILVDNDEKRLQSVSTECQERGLKVEYYCLDLQIVQDIEKMLSRLFKKYRKIDALVNNARGGSRTAPLAETEDNWQLTMDVSIKAPLFLAQSYIEEMWKAKSTGCIVNISSIASTMVGQESTAYHLAKSALDNLTRYLAVHGGPKGVRVNAVRPGFIVQDEHRERFSSEANLEYRKMAESCHPLQKVGKSDDIANVVQFLCSESASFVTGQVITVDGGLSIRDQWDLTYSTRLK